MFTMMVPPGHTATHIVVSHEASLKTNCEVRRGCLTTGMVPQGTTTHGVWNQERVGRLHDIHKSRRSH